MRLLESGLYFCDRYGNLPEFGQQNKNIMDCVWNILLLEWIGIGCLSGIPITFLCLGCIFPLMGFTVCGIAAGSLAACCQSSIGDVVKGSCFAWMQSIGALGHPVCCGITVILGFILEGVLGGVIFTQDPDLVTEAMQDSAETICEVFNAYNGTNSTSTNSTLLPLALKLQGSEVEDSDANYVIIGAVALSVMVMVGGVVIYIRKQRRYREYFTI